MTFADLINMHPEEAFICLFIVCFTLHQCCEAIGRRIDK